MRKVIIQLVCAGLLGVSVASGIDYNTTSLNGVRELAEREGTNGAVKFLAGYGITNRADRADIMKEWNEEVFVNVAVKCRAFTLLDIALGRDKLSASSREWIKTAILAENPPLISTPELVLKYPVAERSAFTSVVATVIGKRYPVQPEFCRLWMKYTLLQDIVISGWAAAGAPAVSLDDITAYLLAPEPLAPASVEYWKQAMKTSVIKLARIKLREEGKSFVVKDGANPLAAKVKPVVDALNAPACLGLESALRTLGADVRDYDRKALMTVGETWQEQIMRGDLTATEYYPLLGKLAIVLGVDGYNRFVDEYNNGKAGGK